MFLPAKVRRPSVVALGALLLLGAARADDAVTARLQSNFPFYLDLLAIPNIPDQPADIRRNADFLLAALTARGLAAQRLDNPAGRPMVYAEAPPGPARTLLFYIHFDGQPVIPAQWAQASPFTPVIKRRDGEGRWQEVPRDRLTQAPLDPELRIFARSASDDKAPILMLLTALDLLRAEGKAPAIRLKLILDSEEEIGSPSLAGVIAAHRDLFAADGLVILDGPAHPSNRPTLVFGNRGVTQATLTVYGPSHPLHSGHFGNYVANPAFRLAALLASMKDEQGRVVVAGYYDGNTLTPEDRAVLAQTPDDAAALLKRAGVARPEAVGQSYQEALQYPSLNIRGMAAAAVGDKAANIIPSEAVAELDLRTTPETDGARLLDRLRAHIERQGYHLVEGPPSEDERARFDRLASLRVGAIQAAERTPMDRPIGRWAFNALAGLGSPPVLIRMMGGTVPTDVLVDALHLPFVLLPLVNADNNQHSYDENVRIGNLQSGTRQLQALLQSPYP